MNQNMERDKTVSQQKVDKLHTHHIAAKVIEETEQTFDDDISKYTGRLEQVFETSRLKNRRLEAQGTQDDHIELLQESPRFNPISVPSPKFALHESKSQSSPSSQGLSLLEEDDLDQVAVGKAAMTIDDLALGRKKQTD
mmetsp:Transcript_99/g.211  ORF Transcript_99/g.211 Transcript_99/m.211 type:complete len:139 (-) Transcript_99:1017-1433(-)